MLSWFDTGCLWTGRIFLSACAIAGIALLPQWLLEYPARWFGYWPKLMQITWFFARSRHRRCRRWLGRR